MIVRDRDEDLYCSLKRGLFKKKQPNKDIDCGFKNWIYSRTCFDKIKDSWSNSQKLETLVDGKVFTTLYSFRCRF